MWWIDTSLMLVLLSAMSSMACEREKDCIETISDSSMKLHNPEHCFALVYEDNFVEGCLKHPMESKDCETFLLDQGFARAATAWFDDRYCQDPGWFDGPDSDRYGENIPTFRKRTESIFMVAMCDPRGHLYMVSGRYIRATNGPF